MKYNLKGQKFNRWNVIDRGHNVDNRVAWNCICECGNKGLLTSRVLMKGQSKSCGCYLKDKMTKHGHNTSIKTSPEYNSWHGIKQRCLNKNDKRYHDYGGRGITICDRWLDFNNFLEDMGNKPSKEHSIDRIDNEKGYFKENCKWSTKKEQQRNQRINKRNQFGVRGVTFDKSKNKFLAQMYCDGKKVLMKRFDKLEDAIKARKEAESIYWRK